jgi:Family of unknown function (DUF5670)
MTLGSKSSKGAGMPWMLFATLLVLWLMGLGFHLGGDFIHVLLVFALAVLVFNLLRSGRAMA